MPTFQQDRLFSQRILDAYNEMSRGERYLADVLLENPLAILDQTATQLSERAGVSKATTARFFRLLGYPSYKAAQAQARVEGISSGQSQYGSRMQTFRSHKPDLSIHLQSEVQNMVRTLEQQRSDHLDQAVHILARGEKLWVVGFADNYPLAHFARAQLIRVRPDIRLIPLGSFSVAEEFASISASDAFLAFGVLKRIPQFRNVLKSAIGAGSKVVYLTDQMTRTGDDIATVTLRCRTRSTGLFDTVVPTLSLINYLCSALAIYIGESAMERLNMIDEIHAEWDDLLSDHN
ncbi:MurR/RpiR family transcriptional regulator [Roseibium aggregatum]|uniref:MurR/RpiR family transcriptional regulator n=1 Tax=Roseibium aggregatum TaxID=187304 RepID=A0A939EG83_9HYPH|nr:MurR/RpiR family transcriptional regulator [Roseibium aggregatum]MBN9672156.1 MurR/RpiR family transcriptional regulator [Roseibium aggregatum]